MKKYYHTNDELRGYLKALGKTHRRLYLIAHNLSTHSPLFAEINTAHQYIESAYSKVIEEINNRAKKAGRMV
jgi:hypothetical protein